MTDTLPTPNVVADLCADFAVQYTRTLNAAQDLAILLGRPFRLDIQYTSAGHLGSLPTIVVEVILDPPIASRRTFPAAGYEQITFGGPSLGDVHRQISEYIRTYLDRAIPQVAERAEALASLQRVYPPTV